MRRLLAPVALADLHALVGASGSPRGLVLAMATTGLRRHRTRAAGRAAGRSPTTRSASGSPAW